MADDSEKPESGTGEPEAPKIKAEDNPWYLLATLYGVPEAADDELRASNRIAWNRYFAANLDEETRTKLIDEKRHPAEELRPFSPNELQEVAAAFAERCKESGKNLALPESGVDIDFSNVAFEQDVFFEGYLFSRFSCFRNTVFSGRASFDGATFSDRATFDDAIFSDVATFDGATFSDVTTFDGAAFSLVASFDDATFSDVATFDDATFSAGATFDGATFSDGVDFNDATFSGMVIFRGTASSYVACFDGAKFQTSSSFVNAEMKGETSFKDVTFKTEPPHFFGAKLHQGTVWRGIDWPTPKKADEAGAFIDAYACLKLEMDRLKKHEDELDFFALELQSRRVLLESELKGSGLPIALYGLVADYCRSYARPLYALFAVALVGTLVLLLSGSVAPWRSPALSIANTLNVFGFRKDFFDAATIERLPALLKILAALQTIFGTILLFLFGLGIRNKFRMK